MPRKAPAAPITEPLRAMIRASNKSQNQIATESKIAQPIINRFVNGNREISGRNADKLAAYFNMRLAPDIQPG